MKTAIKRLIRGESGRVLELVLIMLTLGGLVMAPMLGLMSTGLLAGRVYEEKAQEYYAADAGVEDAIAWLLDGKPENQGWIREGSCQNQTARRVSPIYINDRRVDVRLERLPASNTYKIISTATGPQGSTTVLCTLFAVAWLKGDLRINYRFVGDLYLDGNATLENPRGQVLGNVVVLGDLDLRNSTNITGNVSVEGDVTLEQYSRLNGNLCVGGDLTLQQNTTITGNVSVEGNLVVGESARIDGDAFVGGNITLHNKATITGNVYAHRDITITIKNPQTCINGNVCAKGNVAILLQQAAKPPCSVCAQGEITIDGKKKQDCSPCCSGPVCNHYSGCNCTIPARPSCPDVPVDPLDIYTWQILGVGM